jgi:ABC-2 type transport system ATP-binding protein
MNAQRHLRVKELAALLELDLGRKIKELSRGNRRKVSLIKSVLPDPRLLILDEPTSGLDPLMQLRVFDLLQKQRERGSTVFFSSHILSEVQKICNRVAIIRD